MYTEEKIEKFCWNCEAMKKCEEHFVQIFKDFDETFRSIFGEKMWKK